MFISFTEEDKTTIEALPSVEKFRLLQFLVAALGKETGLLLDASVTYSVWTPYFVLAETVAKMEKMLVEDTGAYAV